MQFSRGFRRASALFALAAGVAGGASCAERSRGVVYLDDAPVATTAPAPRPTLPVVRQLVELRGEFERDPGRAMGRIGIQLQWAAETRYDLGRIDGDPPTFFEPASPRQLARDVEIVVRELEGAKSPEHRLAALTILGSIARYATPHVPVVSKYAGAGTPRAERLAALRVLARAATGEAGAMRALDEAARDPDETVRQVAKGAEPPPTFVGDAKRADGAGPAATQPMVRLGDVAATLPALPPPPSSIAEPWVYDLERLAGKFDRDPKGAYADIAAYVEYVRDRRFDTPYDDNLRNWPQRFTPEQYKGDAAIVAKYVGRGKSTEQRQAALALLLPLGRYAAPYLGAVRKCTDSREPAERLLALRVLARAAADDAGCRAAFARALADANADVRLGALTHWAAWPTSDEWVRLLVPLISDPNAAVAQRAVTLLLAASPSSGVAGGALVPFIHAKDPELRQAARSAFDRLSVRAAAPIESLIDALRDDDPRVRRDAALALSDRQADRDEVMRALVAAVDGGDFVVRVALTDALERAVVLHSDSLTVLAEVAEDEADPTGRAYARVALRRIVQTR